MPSRRATSLDVVDLPGDEAALRGLVGVRGQLLGLVGGDLEALVELLELRVVDLEPELREDGA